jgi:hypothetical protein
MPRKWNFKIFVLINVSSKRKNIGLLRRVFVNKKERKEGYELDAQAILRCKENRRGPNQNGVSLVHMK